MCQIIRFQAQETVKFISKVTGRDGLVLHCYHGNQHAIGQIGKDMSAEL